jgi:hypothetical protein
MPTRSYLSQCELPVTFGLGTATQVDRVIIHWADGSKQDFQPAAVDRAYSIEQSPATPSPST